MSAPRFLVAGGDRVDAGKTTFSTGLLARISESGVDATGIKPRAGNDFWFDHDDVRAVLAEGRLYGTDANRLSAASQIPLGCNRDTEVTVASDVVPEAINPVHRLWRPTPGRTGLLGEADRTFLVDRVSTADGVQYVVNGQAEEEGLLPEVVRDALPLENATRVREVPAFNEVMRAAHVPALERLADRVRETDSPILMESYGDIAYPLDVAVDAVAVVDPTRARIYAGDRYGKARAVAGGSAREGQLEERTGAVTEMIEPIATVDLPALPSETRSDPEAVADAYEAAFDALIDAV